MLGEKRKSVAALITIYIVCSSIIFLASANPIEGNALSTSDEPATTDSDSTTTEQVDTTAATSEVTTPDVTDTTPADITTTDDTGTTSEPTTPDVNITTTTSFSTTTKTSTTVKPSDNAITLDVTVPKGKQWNQATFETKLSQIFTEKCKISPDLCKTSATRSRRAAAESYSVKVQSAKPKGEGVYEVVLYVQVGGDDIKKDSLEKFVKKYSDTINKETGYNVKVSTDSDDSGLSGGVIALIVILVIVGVGAAVVAVYYFVRKRRQRSDYRDYNTREGGTAYYSNRAYNSTDDNKS